jgi:HPt (histidine-containing phosphotransfer) domain-containing protein
MENQLKYVNLQYVNEISEGDLSFKKHLIEIFLKQIPEFISNLNKFFTNQENENLAREAHTMKSSVLVFMMEDTGKKLNEIQLLSKTRRLKRVPFLIEDVVENLENAARELTEYLSNIQKTNSSET